MTAYVIGHIHVRDPKVWQEYVSQVGATITGHGGEVMARGLKAADLDGEMPGERLVILRFADIAAARTWHEAPDYQRLIPLRDASADVTLTIFQE